MQNEWVIHRIVSGGGTAIVQLWDGRPPLTRPHVKDPDLPSVVSGSTMTSCSMEVMLSNERGSTGREARPTTGDRMPTALEFASIGAPLLRHLVAALAMRHGRAPLPVSPALWKGLVGRGLPSCIEELGEVARRYMFLGDARMLLAELNARQKPNQARRAVRLETLTAKPEEHPESGMRRIVDDKS